MEIKNMTWHSINIEWGKEIPSDWMVRATESLQVLDRIQTKHWEITIGESVYDVPTIPPKKEWQIIIASNVICVLHKDRDDLYMPRGKSYDKAGNISVRWLQKNPFYIGK